MDRRRFREAIQRARPLSALPPPAAGLRCCVTIPARDECGGIARCLAALLGQVDFDGRPLVPGSFEVLLLANNCTDRTGEISREMAASSPHPVHVIERDFPPGEAHVGTARRLLMDLAAERLGPTGLIATTDADTRADPCWIAAMLGEMRAEIAAVAGQVAVDFTAVELSHPRIADYQRAHEENEAWRDRLASALEIVPHEGGTRHSIHTAASFALRADIYERIGGMPALATGEDIALYRNILAAGGLVRHSPRVRVATSGRQVGRVPAGLATALAGWHETAVTSGVFLVESPEILAAYFTARAGLRKFLAGGNAGEIPKIPGIDRGFVAARLGRPVELLMDEIDGEFRRHGPLRPVPWETARREFSAAGTRRCDTFPPARGEDAGTPRD